MLDNNYPTRCVKCIKCLGEMGAFEACLGSSRPENRGRIMQRCKVRTCNYTVFHSAAYPAYDIALQIANHYNQTIPIPVKPALNTELFYPHSLFPTTPDPVTANSDKRCMGATCRREQKLSRLAQRCSFQRCSSCCDEEFITARRDNVYRKECAFHYKRPIQASGPVNIPIPSTPIIPMRSFPTDTTANPPSIIADSSRTLSTSIGPLWVTAMTSARARSHVKKQISQVKLEKHILIVIWTKPDSSPIRFKYTISESYPNFCLGMATKLLELLKFQDHLVETWVSETNEWVIHEISTLRQVADGQRVLYRIIQITGSPFSGSWVGLDEEMELQPKLKRNTRPFISPIKAHYSSSSTQDTHSPPSPAPAMKKLHGVKRKRQSSQQASRPKKNRRIQPFPLDLKSKCITTEHTVQKRWPAGFYTCELKDGFDFVVQGQKQHIPLSELLQDCFKQYIPRSTFYRIRNLFNDLDPIVRSKFIKYGRTSQGLWSNLIQEQDNTTSDLNLSESDFELPNPETLLQRHCPLCDAVLSNKLTPTLEELYRRLKMKSSLSDKSHHFSLLRDFCAGHTLQMKADEKPGRHNWISPTDIDYTLLVTRVESLKSQLQEQLTSPEENPLLQRVKQQFKGSGNSVISIKGLMERMNFEHCGYYGEESGLIIHKTLLKLFPTPEDLNPNLHEEIKPLNYGKFLIAILVPYTSILLIQADCGVTFDKAFQEWQDSADYGSFYTKDCQIKTEEEEVSMTQNTNSEDIIVISDED